MPSTPRRAIFRPAALVLGLILGAGACAPPLPRVTPGEIPALERRLQESPDDPELQTRLGIGYYQADRLREALSTLEAAREDGATGGALHLYLGLTREQLEDFEGARRAYSSYLESGDAGALQEDIQARLSFLVQRQLQQEARQALAREDELTDEPPTPRSVAVFPFRLISERPELEPLGVALADMMITDLALAGGLTVLERTKIQTLLDEMALTEAGYTEPETGARAGRMLRAEHVVQGALTAVGSETLEMTTDVRNTVRRETAGQASGREPLQQLFDLEKQTVFQVLDVLGVDLTPAEREAINENRTENIQAFLAYGRGLSAMDRNDYAEAVSQFGQALQLDPGFQAAQSQSQQVGQVQQATTSTTDQIAQRAGEAGGVTGAEDADQTSVSASGDLLQRTADETNPNRGTSLTDQGNPVNGTDQQTTDRDPTQEARGSDQVSDVPTGVITITIPRPGASGGSGGGGG